MSFHLTVLELLRAPRSNEPIQPRHSLSPVYSKTACLIFRPAGRVTTRRKKLVPSGAATSGSPSGYQIQEVPDRMLATSVPSWPIHWAFQSDGFNRPMVQEAGSLHLEALPFSSQTRTFQKQ